MFSSQAIKTAIEHEEMGNGMGGKLTATIQCLAAIGVEKAFIVGTSHSGTSRIWNTVNR